MKHLLIMLLLLCSMSVSAQDVIVKKDGSTVVCRVVTVTGTEITYKKWSDLKGSNYVMDKSLAARIDYENGKSEVFGTTESRYTPHNQNDGTQKMNDVALIGIDKAIQDPIMKVKRLKIIGWVGGIALVGGGILTCATAEYGNWFDKENTQRLIGGIAIGTGVVWATVFLVAANNIQKNMNITQSMPIYQYDLNLGNSSTLSAGIDMINDLKLNNKTLGLGLRYNF